MPQTVILDAPPRGFAGQLNFQFPWAKVSRFAESAGIVAGQPVLRGTDDDQVLPLINGSTVSEATLCGWAMLDGTRAFNSEGAIQEFDGVTTVRKGVIYVLVDAAVTEGLPVYVGNATAQLGGIRGATATGYTLCPGARFIEDGASGAIVAMEINLPAS